MKIIIDTNVFISALESRRGASFKLLSLIDENKFKICISVPLIFEYDDVAKRNQMLKVSHKQIDDIIDYLCKVGEKIEIFYLWRPVLSDPKDDFMLELAVNASADYIITFNKKDFMKGKEKFNINAITPQKFLKIIGENNERT